MASLVLSLLKPSKAILVGAEKSMDLNVAETAMRYGCDRSLELFLRDIESIVLDVLSGLFNGVKENDNLAKIAIKLRSIGLSRRQTAGARLDTNELEGYAWLEFRV